MSTTNLRESTGGLRSSVQLGNVQLSNPPTEKELDEISALSPRVLGAAYKRNLSNRIFVNRDLRLDKIKWIGFDMDYTIARYNENYETLSYNLLVNRLVNMGYPEDLRKLKYDPLFSVRGIILDKDRGNFLKIDNFGFIAQGTHGRKPLPKETLINIYPSLYINDEEIGIGKKFFCMDTLFNTPEACLYADVLEYLEAQDLKIENPTFSPNNLFQDVRAAMDWVHLGGELKKYTLEHLDKYLKNSQSIPILFDRLRKNDFKVFLVTNSEYYYTDRVLNFIFQSPQLQDLYKSWRDYFDVIIVGAKKPTFFDQGTSIREVNIETGNLMIGQTKGFQPGRVYQGGGIDLFEKWTGAGGNQVLYVGDHIYADIIKSKKKNAWRNLLVVPELERELNVWTNNRTVFNRLTSLEIAKAEIFKDLDSNSTIPPETSTLRKRIKQIRTELDASYNEKFGSLFRCGGKISYFGWQLERYADLYAYDFINLIHYPRFYNFTATYNGLPHEDI